MLLLTFIKQRRVVVIFLEWLRDRFNHHPKQDVPRSEMEMEMECKMVMSRIGSRNNQERSVRIIYINSWTILSLLRLHPPRIDLDLLVMVIPLCCRQCKIAAIHHSIKITMITTTTHSDCPSQVTTPTPTISKTSLLPPPTSPLKPKSQDSQLL